LLKVIAEILSQNASTS